MHIKHSNDTRPDLEYVRACVAYDPISGALTWKERPVEHFVDARSAASWNSRFAGKAVKKRVHGYVCVVITFNRKEHYCQGHRVAWALKTGAWPEHEVDHENRVRDDNRWLNLRDASHQRNQWNKGLSVRNQSGVIGVHRHSVNDSWIAQIRLPEGATKHLGSFKSLDEAQAARQHAALAHHGEFAHGEIA